MKSSITPYDLFFIFGLAPRQKTVSMQGIASWKFIYDWRSYTPIFTKRQAWSFMPFNMGISPLKLLPIYFSTQTIDRNAPYTSKVTSRQTVQSTLKIFRGQDHFTDQSCKISFLWAKLNGTIHRRLLYWEENVVLRRECCFFWMSANRLIIFPHCVTILWTHDQSMLSKSTDLRVVSVCLNPFLQYALLRSLYVSNWSWLTNSS